MFENRTYLLFILLLFLYLSSPALADQPLNKNFFLADYYDFIDSIKNYPIDAKIKTMQNYLQQHPEFDRIYFQLIDNYLLKNGNLNNALIYFEQLSRNSKFKPNSVWALAKIHELNENYEAALKTYIQALKYNQTTISLLKEFNQFCFYQRKNINYFNVLDNLKLNPIDKLITKAAWHRNNFQFAEALKIYNNLPVKIQNHWLITHFSGDCNFRLSRFKQTEFYWRQGLINSRKRGDKKAEAKFLNNIGVLHKAYGKYDKASAYYDSAFALIGTVDDLELKQLFYGNRANLKFYQENYKQARANYQLAIDLAVKIRLFHYAMIWYEGYGSSCYHLDQFYEAWETFNQCEQLAQKYQNDGRLTAINYQKISLLAYLNQFSLAKELLDKTMQIAKAAKLTNMVNRLKVKQADILLVEGKYDEGRSLFKEHVKYLKDKGRHREYAYWLWKLAETYRMEKKYNSAKEYYAQAATAAKNEGLNIYSIWYQLKTADMEAETFNYDKAISKYQKILQSALEENDISSISQVYISLGKAYFNMNRISNAISSFKNAIAYIEKKRKKLQIEQFKIGYFSGESEVYQGLVNCFFKQYKEEPNPAFIDSIFYYEQQIKGRALKEYSLIHLPNDADSKSDEAYLSYLVLCQKLQKLQRQLRITSQFTGTKNNQDQLLSELQTLRYSLMSKRLSLASVGAASNKKFDNSQISIKEALHLIERLNLGILIYDISDYGSFVLVLKPGDFQIFDLKISPNELTALTDSLASPFHNIDNEAISSIKFRASIAHRLFKILFEPIEKNNVLPQNILILPDPILANLSFDMLLTERPKTKEYSPLDFPDYENSFLLKKYCFSYAPFISFPLITSKIRKSKPDILVFANPVTFVPDKRNPSSSLRSDQNWYFAPLPFSAKEALNIKNVHSKTKILSKENATKLNFKNMASKFDILHFATHGFVDLTFDEFSGLVFTPEKDSIDDGFLMGYEIADLELSSDLVCLSGCETGRGKTIAGEGVLGLPRLFLKSGAKTVLMTLWQVDDRFTSKIMPEFYHNLLNNHNSKIESLAKAKQSFIKETTGTMHCQHPFFWAAFCLYGNPGINKPGSMLTGYILKLLVSALIFLLLAVVLIRIRRKRK